MKKIVAGVIIMAVGAFLLLNNMGFFIPDVYKYVISWQTLLIAIGFVFLFDRHSDHKTVGAILIVIGSIFLLSKIFPLSVKGVILPVCIIALGIYFVVNAATRKNRKSVFNTWFVVNPGKNNSFNDLRKGFEETTTTNNGGVVRKEYAFSGSKEKWTQGKLRNLEIEAVFSGVELDLSQAELDDDIKVAARIKIESIFSGITLYVPEDWNIMINKSGAFGGFTDNRPNRVIQASGDKLVVLEIETVFGGGEIRCYE